MLLCVRTCPYQSWQNIAEGVISTLNLALQSVSLEHSAMAPEHERAVKGKSTLTDPRGVISKDPTLKAAIQDSMAAPMALVGRRFQSMKIKENSVKLGVPATEQMIDELFQHVSSINSSYGPYCERFIECKVITKISEKSLPLLSLCISDKEM